jgi:hypothetical protein
VEKTIISVKGSRARSTKFQLRGRFSTVTRNGRAIVLDTNRLLHSAVAKRQLSRLKESLDTTTA